MGRIAQRKKCTRVAEWAFPEVKVPPRQPGDFCRSRRNHQLASSLFFVYDTARNNAKKIPIESFTVAEKLLLMERLWEDLSNQPSNVAPPEWHGDILAARLAAVKEGRTEFVDWDAAKERLRNRLK